MVGGKVVCKTKTTFIPTTFVGIKAVGIKDGNRYVWLIA